MDESNDLHVFGSVHIYALLEEDLEELEVEQDRDSSDGEEEILILLLLATAASLISQQKTVAAFLTWI